MVRHEGERAKPYKDTKGKLTIGIGRNLDDRGLSPIEIELLFQNDVDIAIADLDRVLPWWRELDSVRQRAMIELCFNMGVGNQKKGLLSFRRTLPAIARGEWETAYRGLLGSKWARDVKPTRARRVAGMILTGNDPD